MVILATLALSVMIGNHWLTPLLVRGPWASPAAGGRGDLRGAVLMQRRVGILVIVLLSWAYGRAIAGSDALADIGAVSFSALATLAPALGFAVWRPRTPARAVGLGLAAAVLSWIALLLLPLLLEGFGGPTAWLREGLFGWSWLAPDQLFGLGEWSRLGRAVTLSLLAGTTVTWLASAGGQERVEPSEGGGLARARLHEIAARFLPADKLQGLLADAGEADDAVSRVVELRIERELAAVLGAASARLLLDAARREQGRDLDAVANIVGEASQALRFNQRVLEAALENMSQGISVVDPELRLVAWNARYAQLFAYPEPLLRVGVPIAELVAHNLRRGLAGDGDGRREVQKRIAHMRAGTPYVAERRFGDSVIEIRGNPMPGGGFVATFTDVTAFRRTEAELKGIAETLEQRVVARTAELEGAKGEAERANAAKTRFLAAVSHDLAQPLNAAHLFTHALAQQLEHAQYREAIGNIDGALGSAEGLLAGLLDISRLDAGGLAPNVHAFCVDEVLQPLAAEFGVLAQHKGLRLHYVPSRAWVCSDPQLLRRALQNFLANAVRYTGSGSIVLGCRRRGGALAIEVHDTGPGIAEADQALIFEEFRRLDRGGQGLGLGWRSPSASRACSGIRWPCARGRAKARCSRSWCRAAWPGGPRRRWSAWRRARCRAVACWWWTTTTKCYARCRPCSAVGIARCWSRMTMRRRGNWLPLPRRTCFCSTTTSTAPHRPDAAPGPRCRGRLSVRDHHRRPQRGSAAGSARGRLPAALQAAETAGAEIGDGALPGRARQRRRLSAGALRPPSGSGRPVRARAAARPPGCDCARPGARRSRSCAPSRCAPGCRARRRSAC
jgi:signal transduction histidine kinase